MIIVSTLDNVEQAFKDHRPGYVVSILDDTDPSPPQFASVPEENHIRLNQDCSRGENRDCDSARCARLLDLAEKWRAEKDPKPAILIHCHKGVSRSMAVAYILMCAIERGRCEKEIAGLLRNAAPHADPNLMLISEADALLGRDDRMVEAVLDLCPSCGAVDKPVVVLPVTA